MSFVKTYRKLPVEVKAIQFVHWSDAIKIMAWCSNAYFVPEGYEHPARYKHEYDRSNGDMLATAPAFMIIKTLEGDMRANRTDWIIKGIAGEFYPCTNTIFNETYEGAT